jgi:PAS domain S-box-containing protein
LERDSSERKRIETELLEKQSILREQNINLVRKSIELSDIKRELEDKNYELELIRSELRNQNVNLVRRSIELSDMMRQLEDRNYDLQLSQTDLRKMLAALHESEERYRELVENANDVIYGTDDNGHFTFVNPVAKRMIGYSEQELIGRHYLDLIRPDHRQDAERFYGLQFVERIPNTYYEFPAVTRDGTELWLGQNAQLVMEDDRVVGFQAVARDITERRRAEEKIEHLNLVLHAIRNVNQLITRERDRARLLQGACETLIATRGYHSAWVALLDDSEGLVTTAEAGLGEDFLPLVERLKRGGLTDCGQRALKQSGGVVTEDPSSTCTGCPLSSMYDGRGAVTIRLGYGGKVYGLLSVSIPGDLAADEEERALFEEVAGDIAFALHNMELEEEAQRRAAQAALVYEVGQRVSHKLELNELLPEIVTTVRDAFDFYGVMILLVDEKANRLTTQSIAGAYANIFPRDLSYAIGEGMIGYAAATGKTQISGDVSKGPHYVREADEETKSELAVPIKSGQKVIGVLDIQSDEFEAFDETDVMLIETLADQIAAAIENARLFEETQTRAEELAVLNEMGRALTAMLDVDAVVKNVYHHASRLIDTTNFYVALYDAEQDMVSFPLYAEGEQIRVAGRRRAGKGMTEYVIRTREPLLIQENIAARLEELGIEMIGTEAQSWLGVPMTIGDQVLGVIAVQSYTTPWLYDERDRDLLSAIANQAAIAIKNARLFDETHSRAERLAVVNHIAKAASATLHLDDLMETVYREIAPVFQGDAFFIALYDEETDELDFCFLVDEGARSYPGRIPLNGLTSLVVTEKKPLVIRDLEQEQDRLPAPVLVGGDKLPASWLGVPLMVGERVIGVINVQSYRPHAWGEEDELLLLTIADQVAVALENARLFEDTERRLAQLTALQETTQAVASTLELDKLLNLITQQATTLFQGTGGIINLVDWEKKEDEVVVASGSAASALGWRSPLEGNLSGWVALHNQPVISNQLRSDDRVDPRVRSGELLMQSVVIAPLTIKDQVIGTLVVQDKQGGKAEFNQADLDLLVAFANQAAIAIENARLFEQTEAALKALRVSEERFALAVQGANDGIWDWDIKNNTLYWSPRMKELLGYADGELDVDFDTFESHLHPDDRERVGAVIEAHLKDRVTYDVEQRLRTKSGEYRWFSARGQALWDETGNPLRMIGFTSDITERKRAEKVLKEYSERLEEMVEERTRALRDAQEALIRQEKLAVLGQLAGGVGHELRNPLGAISNAVYFLNMALEEPDPDVKETLEILQKEVRTSEMIISSLLDFARTKPPTRRKVDINEVVQEALSRITVPETVEVVSQLDETLSIILADPDQLGQVFGNITLNAIQAMAKGGQLVVKTSEVSEKLPKSEWVAVSFADTGVGISEENLGKIFEPLFTTRAKGIGLGLAVTKALVEGHEGTIEVQSELGKGSTFTVRLPIRGKEKK